MAVIQYETDLRIEIRIFRSPPAPAQISSATAGSIFNMQALLVQVSK